MLIAWGLLTSGILLTTKTPSCVDTCVILSLGSGCSGSHLLASSMKIVLGLDCDNQVLTKYRYIQV